MVGNGVDELGDVRAFRRRLLLAVDAKGYGGVDAETQRQFQEAIVRLLNEAADTAELDRGEWVTQEGGDSLFAVLPGDASEPALVDDFMRALDAGLRAFNFGQGRRPWLRLRAAVHFGSASLGANGFVGRAPVEVGRILDCAALRTALVRAPYACLAVAVSATVFHDVVQEAYTSIPANEFRRVSVEEKEHRGESWIWVPGADVRQLDLEPDPQEITPNHAPGSGPTVGNLRSGDGSAIAVGHGASATVTNGAGGRPGQAPGTAGDRP
ncbi:hypothetical protein [Streptomyces inhibens]|uniref:hypothetical protein n=1 Tax=Streptomyces inhibens TaxID=2293571 RepID=UPI001EE76D61|nr:hypothetical protein [Streptomyces inhibens]UKY48172.1 hypothetical protein KI385_04660 [Streptomyces inhibens]